MKAKQQDRGSILILHGSVLPERCGFLNPFLCSGIVRISLGCN